MSNPDRNAYEPSYEDEDIDNFDATDEEEEESSGRSPVLIILGLLVLAGFGAVVWMAYEQGKRQSVRTETPTLLADQTPTKVAPDNPGGTNTAGDGKLVYDQVTGTRTQTSEQLLPPAETPATRPDTTVTTTPTTNLGSPTRPTTTTGSTTTATGPRTSDPTTSTTPTGSNLRPTTTADAGTTTDTTMPTTTTQPKPTTTAPTTTTTGTRPTTTATAPTTTAPTTTAPTTTAPTTTQPKPTTTTGDQVATITQVDPTVVPPATSRSTGSGTYVVQVGSYPNDAAAASAWQSIKGKNTSLLSTYKPDVVAADLGPKGKWYRLRVGPFDSKESASDLCTKLQANGQACLVAKP
jgi:hypothetical protein